MWILGGEFFFWSKAVDPRRKPRVYCLAPEKNPPLISTTQDILGSCWGLVLQERGPLVGQSRLLPKNEPIFYSFTSGKGWAIGQSLERWKHQYPTVSPIQSNPTTNPLSALCYAEPNFSFPHADLQAGQTTPLIRLRIKYYAQDCPHSIGSSTVCDFPMLSGHSFLF